MVTHGWQRADIQRMRDGWDDAFDPEVWERLSGGRVAPPSGFLDSLMCSCWEGQSAGGEACAVDELSGVVVESATEWTWSVSEGRCEAKAKCRNGGPCSCYDESGAGTPRTGARYLLDGSGSYGLTPEEINSTCGMDGEHDPNCLEVTCTEGSAGCGCHLFCAEKGSGCSGDWVRLRKSNGKKRTWEPCPEGERWADDFVATRAPCLMEDHVRAAMGSMPEPVSERREQQADFAEWLKDHA